MKYYSKYSEDDEHPVYFRKSIKKDAIEEELLDVNELAKEKEYYTARTGSTSPNNQLISVYENTTGKDEFVLKIKDLNSRTFLTDSIQRIGNMIWVDDTNFLYVEVEKGTYRSSKVMRHVLGTNSKNDVVIAFSINKELIEYQDFLKSFQANFFL